MSIPKELRAIADRVSDEIVDAYEQGHHDALQAVTNNLREREKNNPRLKSLSIDAIIGIIASHHGATRNAE